MSTRRLKLPPEAVTLNTIPSVLPISVVLLSAKTAPVELAVTLKVPVRCLDLSVLNAT